MTAVCQTLGLARSNLHTLRGRPASWVDGRTQRTPRGDEQSLADIREQITELPSYGYRRARVLVNRKRASAVQRE
jgi:putative transposase